MSPWDRLAQHVIARRLQLGYKTRHPFAEALGIGLRTLGDIETGRRDKYDPKTIASLENVLQWRTGSVEIILDGGDPTPVSDAPTKATSEADEALVRVMNSDLTDDQKRRVVRMLIEEKNAADRRRLDHADDLIRLLRDTP